MSKRACFYALLLVLALSMVSAFRVELVKADTIAYIRADGSIDPPTAQIATVDNVTYILTGNITVDSAESTGIAVERDNIILDGAGFTIHGAGSGEGIALNWRSNVTIRSTNIKDFSNSAFLYSSNNITISGNNMTNNSYGLYLSFSNNTNIVGNVFVNDGLYVFHSYDNSVTDNLVNNKPLVYLEDNSDVTVEDAGQVILVNCSRMTVESLNLFNVSVGVQVFETNNITISSSNITKCTYGIWLHNSNDSNIFSNNITDNGLGIYLYFSSDSNIVGNVFLNDGLRVHHSYGNVVEGNLVNGKPLVYLEDTSYLTVEDAGQVILVNCDNIQVRNLNLTNTADGLLLHKTNNSVISDNNMTNNRVGITVYQSSHNNIAGNNISGNERSGIYHALSYSNRIAENTIANNGFGIFLGESSINNVTENNITANEWHGISLASSSNNRLYHNNFVDNPIPVWWLNPGNVNIWNDDYPSGGNYWSDYSGSDYHCGLYQNKTGSDGIGDAPYVVDADNQDEYPLMGPFGGSTATGENVTVFPSNDSCLIFENVTTRGETSVYRTSEGSNPPPRFKITDQYYNIETTAEYSGLIKLRLIYNDSALTLEEEQALKLWHWNDTLSDWEDITTGLDTEYNVIFGETMSLSAFAVVKPFPYDVNGDYYVGVDDIFEVALHFGAEEGQPEYEPLCDINADSYIGIDDVFAVASHFGEEY